MNAATFVKLISLGTTSSKEDPIQSLLALCYILLVDRQKMNVSAQK